jgi:DNA-directed RNA polymerase specialized sigma24 family protein
VTEEAEETLTDPAEAKAEAKAEARLEKACLPPYEGDGLPPELATLPKAELVLALKVVRLWLLKQTKSESLSEELAQIVFLKMTRTRRWNPAKGPFGRHFMLCAKSEKNHHFASKAPEREALARQGFAREELPSAAASPEDVIVRAETETQELAALEAKATREVELLRARIANHDLMPRVLACIEQGIEGARAIADTIGVPVVKVYRALDLIRHHIKKIRETETETEKRR